MKFPKPYKWKPNNPEKYIGDVDNIWVRSGMEKKVMLWLDRHPGVLKWGSEETFIPYVSPVDHQIHRYFVDFFAMVKTKNGEIVKYLVEVKPKSQTVPPKKPKKMSPRYLSEIETYAVNDAKWNAARKFCDKYSMKFMILTEEQIDPRKP